MEAPVALLAAIAAGIAAYLYHDRIKATVTSAHKRIDSLAAHAESAHDRIDEIAEHVFGDPNVQTDTVQPGYVDLGEKR